jgi:Tol biopolymer transport system component
VSLDQVRGKILFKTDREGSESVYVMDPDGRNQKRVPISLYLAAAQWESWSPDHTQVASVHNEGFTQKFGYDNDIWITDPSGGSGRALSNPANDYDPAWSPRGLFDGLNWLAFVSNRGGQAHSENQGEELWVMHPDGTNPLRLTCHGPAYSKHPSWSPDATHLVFYSNYRVGSQRQIYVVDVTSLGSVADPCAIGDTSANLSNNASNDYEPIWVK